MVQNDAHTSIITFHKAPSFIDNRQFVGLVGKVNVALGHRCVSCDHDACIFNFAFVPALQGKACIFWKCWITTHEV